MQIFRRSAAAVLALATVAALTLAPRVLIAPVRATFLEWADVVDMPFVAGAPYAVTERLLNTVMFVPLGVTLALLLPRRAWPVAALAGLVVSAGVEYVQGAIPGRVPDSADVLWNTLGGLIGVMAAAVVRAAAPNTALQRGSVTRT